MHLRVKRPVRDVEALDRVDEGRERELSRREPSASPPAPDVVANPAGIDSKRQHALRSDRRPDLLIPDKGGRAAELAVLPHSRRIEHHDGPTGLALDASPLGLPPAILVGQLTEGLDQIELDDLPLLAIDLIRRLRPAERADQLLRGRIPLRLRTARGALVLLEGCDLQDRNQNPGDTSFCILNSAF